MHKKIQHIIRILAVLCLLAMKTNAQVITPQGNLPQKGFYIPANGKVFFNGDTATIFGNVINEGKMGVGKKAVVNFKGKNWRNRKGGTMTDESKGGEGNNASGGQVRFNGDSMRQTLDGGYNAATRTGAAFANLQVDNKEGVEMMNSSAKVQNELQLKKGHLIVNQTTLVVGNGNPGKITGYDSTRFIVTGGTIDGGLLVRENIAERNGWVVFPIGTSEHSYTPLAVHNKEKQGDDYHARVINDVHASLFSGAEVINESVDKTWEIGKRIRPNVGETDIALQHLIKDEGNVFHTNRRFSYITAFTRTGWDTSYPYQTPEAGYLTSSSAMLSSGVNRRTLVGKIGTASYFTKITGKGDTLINKTRLWFNAYRTDAKNVLVYWNTKPEVGVRYFVVQRRLSNENSFSNRDTVWTKAVNGISSEFLNYATNDPNDYAAISYYRLLMVQRNGDTSYSQIVPVGGKAHGYELLLWPNPSPGKFFVGINGAAAVKYVAIYNEIGQLLKREVVNERRIIEFNIYLPGAYFVSFISHSNQILETKKLIVTGNP